MLFEATVCRRARQKGQNSPEDRYITSDEEEEEYAEEQKNNKNGDEFYANENKYWNPDYKTDDSLKELYVNFTTLTPASAHRCYRYNKEFDFNNKLHIYIRRDCDRKKPSAMPAFQKEKLCLKKAST